MQDNVIAGHTDRVSALLSACGILPSSMAPYLEALVHRSYLNEAPKCGLRHNERLEFLGDAVLELCVTELLFKDFPDKPEGQLTDIRSSCVRGKNLAAVADGLGVGRALLISAGEEKAGGRSNPTLLADALEALLGAAYLDRGLDEARAFVARHVYPTLGAILAAQAHLDPKSVLQEIIQGKAQSLPSYAIVRETGADHDKTFEVEVSFRGAAIGRGSGNSKKRAQEAAASDALARRAEWEASLSA